MNKKKKTENEEQNENEKEKRGGTVEEDESKKRDNDEEIEEDKKRRRKKSSSFEGNEHPFEIKLINSYGAGNDDMVIPEDDQPFRIVLEKHAVVIDWTPQGIKNSTLYPHGLQQVVEHESILQARRNPNQSISLLDCLKLFTTKEKLSAEDAWFCNKCKDHVEATKQFNVWFFPPILVVHLKRFQYSRLWRDKIDTEVEFPIDDNVLDLSQFELSNQSIRPLYQLFAVSNHMGGLGGGHYTACIKHRDKWYNCNDSHVSSINSSHVSGPEAYVLFYRRINHPALEPWDTLSNNQPDD